MTRFQTAKLSFPMLFLVAALCATSTHATVFFTDSFFYADGQLTATALGGNPGDDVSGGLWTGYSGTTFDDNVDVISGQAQVLNSGSEDVNRAAGAVMAAGDTWYYGALFTVNDKRSDPTNPIHNDYFAHFKDDTAGFRGRAYLSDPIGGGDYTIGHSASSGGQVSAWGSDLTFGEEHTVIVSYDFDTGDSKLWLDPTDINSTSLSDSGGGMTDISALALRQVFISPGDPNNEVLVNAVAIGDDFDAVLSAVPEPTGMTLLLFALPLFLRLSRNLVR